MPRVKLERVKGGSQKRDYNTDVGKEVLIYSRDEAGNLDPESFTEAVISAVRVTMFGERLFMVTHKRDGTNHHELYGIENQKRYASWKAPFWYFCEEGDELEQWIQPQSSLGA